ncbi:A/G-specific adenine glycosylase [Paludisphaera soli]|uniref:A/G-specific adenine glycosylase n=1 Tax=Paludisphaera soli TaxID=2712865 RepID=UPI0013EBD106|nr:A/G-specific adenine glycosylase [Paludisphaera soli]
MGDDRDAEWVATIRRGLLGWFATEQRDLPWRADRDPYRILVSEMMLVQTTVAAVVPFFVRFLGRFPDFQALAAADEEHVLKAWEGLGYYRRARQLHAAAKAVVAEHGGRMRDDPIAVRALPGVGPYLAGAILSQAFGRPEPILEANSQRVLARLLGWDVDLAASASKKRLWEAAARLVPPEEPGDFNQALMELGALICSPRSPRCLFCPVASACKAFKTGVQDRIPRITPRPAPTAVSEACAVVAREGRVLVVRRSGPGLWADFWEFPTIHREGADPAGRSFDPPVGLAEGVERLTGLPVAVVGMLKTLTFGVTRYRVRLEAYAATPLGGEADAKPQPGPGLSDAAWVGLEELAGLTMSSAGRRLVAAIQAEPEAWGLADSGSSHVAEESSNR